MLIAAQLGAQVVAVAGAKRICATCENKFIGTARARYCSPACKQRAHRARRGGNDGYRNAPRVTVTLPIEGQGIDVGSDPSRQHCAEARQLETALIAELAETSKDIGSELEWSAVERLALSMAMSAIDRKVDLEARYLGSNDDKLRAKLSGEIRLLEASIDRLVKRVRTELPEPASGVSRKASHAANVRWQGAAR